MKLRPTYCLISCLMACGQADSNTSSGLSSAGRHAADAASGGGATQTPARAGADGAAKAGRSAAPVAGTGGRSAAPGDVVDQGVAGTSSPAGAGASGTAEPMMNTADAGAAGASGAAGGPGAATQGGAGGSTGKPSCDEPPPASELLGWAASSGMGTDKTTGGGAAAPSVVSTLSELAAAVSGDAPAVIYVEGQLSAGALSIRSNKTVVGLCGAELHGHVSIDGASNIIVRNLKIVGYGVGDCSLDPKFSAAEGCSSGDDAVSVQRSHHIWFDHCDISDGTDGNLDITNGADFVTVSWTRFHYSKRSDPVGNDSTGASGHRFSNLIGGADNVPADVGHLNVTWHHNWWADNVDQRMPRTRAGKIHVWNNLFTSSGNSYCTNAGAGASLLVEGNAYLGVNNPLQPTADGDMRAQDNLFTGSKGSMSAAGKGFTPPYAYTAEPASSIESSVRAGAGPK